MDQHSVLEGLVGNGVVEIHVKFEVGGVFEVFLAETANVRGSTLL